MLQAWSVSAYDKDKMSFKTHNLIHTGHFSKGGGVSDLCVKNILTASEKTAYLTWPNSMTPDNNKLVKKPGLRALHLTGVTGRKEFLFSFNKHHKIIYVSFLDAGCCQKFFLVISPKNCFGRLRGAACNAVQHYCIMESDKAQYILHRQHHSILSAVS